MKIAHVITRPIVGGAQENTLLSCGGQHARGHDVTLVTGPAIGPEGSLLDRARAGGYRVEVVDEMRRAVHPVRDWRSYRRLVGLIRGGRFDVVHTHSSKAGIVGRWAAHAAGGGGHVPAVVHTVHGLAFTASTNRHVNTAYRYLEKWTAPVTDRLVCVADAMRDQSLAGGVGRAGQYVTVYSGMDVGPFLAPPVSRAEVRARLGLADDDVAIGTIARLFHLKGHDDLLDLAPDLCRRFPRARFLWVGDGLLRPQFEARIASLGLTDKFILTGLVPPERVPELAGAMDVLAHPSRREGLARALPQGALCGCPTVTYDVDGNREGLVHGVTGYALPAFDVRRFGDSLAGLLEDDELRRTMGSAGRAFAAERFDTATMVDALERVYADAIAARPANRR